MIHITDNEMMITEKGVDYDVVELTKEEAKGFMIGGMALSSACSRLSDRANSNLDRRAFFSVISNDRKRDKINDELGSNWGTNNAINPIGMNDVGIVCKPVRQYRKPSILKFFIYSLKE